MGYPALKRGKCHAGGTTKITYDSNGNVSTVTDPLGAVTQTERDSKGNITSVTDPLGHTVQYGYDTYNNVISATDPTASPQPLRAISWETF